MAQNTTGRKLVAQLVTETVGTALLCFTIAISGGQGDFLASFAIGCTLMCAIYAGGHISGAHFNPAVTTAVLVRGKISPRDACGFIFSQLVGACIGGGVGSILLPHAIGHPAFGTGVTYIEGFVAEYVITFALTHTVLHVATATATANNHYYGLAIGWTVLSGAISVGGISGGCFNPAVAMLSVLRGKVDAAFAAHTVAPLLAGVSTGFLFRAMHGVEDTVKSTAEWAKYVIEFVGTFMLCITIGLTGATKNPFTPVAIGSMLMCQVYAGGAVSGAMYNPAVTLGVFLRKFMAADSPGSASKRLRDVMPTSTALIYVVVQVCGALGAGIVARIVNGDAPLGHPDVPTSSDLLKAIVADIWGTTFLVFVVLQVATNSHTSGNNFFGIAIGFTVLSMAITVGDFSGGAFNPAVGMLGLVTSKIDAKDLWLYWVGPLCGAALAAGLFRVVSFDNFVHDDADTEDDRVHYSKDQDVHKPSGRVNSMHAENVERNAALLAEGRGEDHTAVLLTDSYGSQHGHGRA